MQYWRKKYAYAHGYGHGYVHGHGYGHGYGYAWKTAFDPAMLVTGVTLEEVALNAVLV